MLTRRVVCSLALLAVSTVGWARDAAGPKRNLLVELRWVESSLSAAALAGMREGATVVGTAGSVSPKSGVTLSTRKDEPAAIQRLIVLNGYSGSVSLGQQTPMQWLDVAVDLPIETARQGQSGGGRVIAVPRSGVVEQTRGFVVSPSWPGGSQPVRVELKAMASGTSPDGQGQSQVFSTVQAPLGEWLTVARSGAAVARAQAGVISSRDAEGVNSRDLQLRVSLAP